MSRTTFLVAPEGTVAKVMHDVNPETHADDVLAALASESDVPDPPGRGIP